MSNTIVVGTAADDSGSMGGIVVGIGRGGSTMRYSSVTAGTAYHPPSSPMNR